MKFIQTDTFKKFFIPGFVLQSIVIAGGYGTGAELIEFFLSFGTKGAIFGALIALATWAVVCVATFEFARFFQVFDYRSFFQKLLGKFWILFEICYLVLLTIVLGVVAASAGSILNELFGLNYVIGVILMMSGVGFLVFKGSEAIKTFLSYWSFVLYSVYIIFLITTYVLFGDAISANLAAGTAEPGFALNGFKYAWYNLGCVPAMLFTLDALKTRKDAVISGVMAAVITMIPGMLLVFALMSQYPEITQISTVPTNYVLTAIGSLPLMYVFQITLFGTLIETGSGFIFAVTERIESVYKQKQEEQPKWIKMTVTIGLLIFGALIAQFGLIGLIAKGYGTITWGFFLVYVIPIVTIGVYMVYKEGKKAPL